MCSDGTDVAGTARMRMAILEILRVFRLILFLPL